MTLLFLPEDSAYATPVTVRRFCNITTGAHFWSASGEECARTLQLLSGVYKYDGMAWTIDDTRVSDPLFRAYNTQTSTHFYTADQYEYEHLPSYFNREGVAYLVNRSPSTGCSRVYRAFNLSTGAHFYTADSWEYEHLPTNFQREGEVFYFPAASPIINWCRRWDDNTNETWPRCRIYVNYQPLPDSWESCVYRARMTWNLSGNSNMYFTYSATSSNVVYTEPWGLNGVLGAALVYPEPTVNPWVTCTGAITCINYSYADTFCISGNASVGQNDLESIIVHELGHWVCEVDDQIIAQDWPWATMDGYYQSGSGDMTNRTLAAEDIDGIQALYGRRP